MSKESKALPREFWINKSPLDNFTNYMYYLAYTSEFKDYFHVIEYSAYAELQDKLFVCEGISENNIKNHSYDLWKKDKALLEERAKSARLLEALKIARRYICDKGLGCMPCPDGVLGKSHGVHCYDLQLAIANYNQSEGGDER